MRRSYTSARGTSGLGEARAGYAGGVLLMVAAIVCGDPRAYEGPREAPSGESQGEQHEAPAVEVPREAIDAPIDADRTIVHEHARERQPQPRFAREPRMPGTGRYERSRSIDQQQTGRGLLIAGGVLAGTGFVISTISVAAWLTPCSDPCEPYGAIVTSIAAPVPWLFGIGMLGGGMQHRSHMIASRRRADRRAMKSSRRGVYGGGLAMAIVGAGAIVGTWWAPGINALAQVGGGPLAVAGAMMAGSARGRRLAIRDHVTVAPVLTRTTTMLSIGTRW